MKYKPVSYDFNDFKKKLLSNKKAEKSYSKLENEFLLLAEMLRARKKANKTQQEIANIMKTTASAISRLESFEGLKKHSPTFETIKKYANAVGCKVYIKFVAKQ